MPPGPRGAPPSMVWWSGVITASTCGKLKRARMRLWWRLEMGLLPPSKTPQTSRSTAATPGSRRRKKWKSPASGVRAERSFINVGGRAVVPAMPGINEVPYLTNSSMMDVDFLPDHLIIVGGSYIGLEFGQMYRRFGSQVTIIEMAPRLVCHEDEDLSSAIKDIVEREGVEVRLNAECISLVKRGDEIIAKVDCTAGAPEVAASHLLLAVGRRPNTDDLDLDKAGVRCDERGYIIVDDRLQTTAPGIWALGDCNGKGAFTHTAYNDFEIVAANLLDHDPRRVSERITAYALYTDPPLGRVGMSLAEARNSGRRVLAGERPMTRVARAVEKGE